MSDTLSVEIENIILLTPIH